MRVAGVEEGEEGHSVEGHNDLHGACHGNPSHGLQEKQGAWASCSVSPTVSTVSPISTPSRKKMRRQNLL